MNATASAAAAALAQEIQLEELIAEAEAGTFGAYSTYASTTLVAFAVLTSLDAEITHIWATPTRPASLLYFVIRYAGLLSEVVFTGLNEGPTCNALLGVGDWLQIITIAGGYILQIIRTRAIYQKNDWLTALLVLAALPAVIFRAWLISIANCENPDPSVTLSLFDLIAELLFESIILIVTVWWTYYLVRQQRILGVAKGSLVEAILSNGILYYCTIVPFDIMGIALIGLNTFGSTVLLQFIAELNIPLRSILLSQFIVDLRRRATTGSANNLGSSANSTGGGGSGGKGAGTTGMTSVGANTAPFTVPPRSNTSDSSYSSVSGTSSTQGLNAHPKSESSAEAYYPSPPYQYHYPTMPMQGRPGAGTYTSTYTSTYTGGATYPVPSDSVPTHASSVSQSGPGLDYNSHPSRVRAAAVSASRVVQAMRDSINEDLGEPEGAYDSQASFVHMA